MDLKIGLAGTILMNYSKKMANGELVRAGRHALSVPRNLYLVLRNSCVPPRWGSEGIWRFFLLVIFRSSGARRHSSLATSHSPFSKKCRLVKGAALFSIKSNKSQDRRSVSARLVIGILVGICFFDGFLVDSQVEGDRHDVTRVYRDAALRCRNPSW